MTVARLHVFAEIDERANYDYVQALAEHGRLPRPTDPISREALAIDDGTWPRPSPRDPTRIGLTGRSYEAIQPPASYALDVPPFLLAGDHRAKVRVLRVFDLLLLAVALALLWRLAVAVAPSREAALGGLAAALAVLLWPGMVVRAVAIGSVGLEVLVTAAFLAAWRADRSGRTGPLVAAALLLGLGLLTKLTLVDLVPVLVIVLVRRVRADRSARALATAAACLALPVVVLAPWLALNQARYDAPTVNIQGEPGVVQPIGSSGGGARLGDLGPLDRRLLDGVLPQEFRAQLGVGWVRAAVDALALALLAAALALLLARGRDVATWLLVLPFLSGLVLVNATYVLTGNDEFLLRYLAPTLPPVALGAGIAAAASRRPAVRRALPVAAGAASLVALALWARRGRGVLLHRSRHPARHLRGSRRDRGVPIPARARDRGLALPLAGLVVLLAAPATDVHWEHHPAHFWLVLSSALTSAVLAYATGDTARRRGDARLFVVALAFLAAAGFLGLHALATPGVLLEKPNAGFVARDAGRAARRGVLRGRCRRRGPSRPHGARDRRAARGLWRGGAARADARLGRRSRSPRVGPLDDATPPESGSAPLTVLAVVGIALYGVAAVALRRPLHAPARADPARRRHRVRAARRGDGRGRVRPQLARELVGVARADAHRVRAGRGRRAAPGGREERFSDLYLDETTRGQARGDASSSPTSRASRRSPRSATRARSRAMLNASFERAIPPRSARTAARSTGSSATRSSRRSTRAATSPTTPRAAARAALAILRATEAAGAEHPDWPRFRIGVNSGEAMVGVVGAREGKSYTVIGDTVNVAARLQGAAPPSGVVVGATTLAELPGARATPLGELVVKGRRAPVAAHLLEGLDRPG